MTVLRVTSYEDQLKEYYKDAAADPAKSSAPFPHATNIDLYTTNGGGVSPPPPVQLSNYGMVPWQGYEEQEHGLQKVIYFGPAFLGLPLWLLLSTQVFDFKPIGTAA